MTGRGRHTAGLAVATIAPLVLAPILAPRRGDGVSELIGVPIVVAYGGHIAVSGWLWTTGDARRTVRCNPLRSIGLPVALITTATILTVSLPGRSLDVLLLGFFAWQFHHFQRQNLGLVRRVSAAWSAEPIARSEARIVMTAMWCGIGALLVHPSFLGLPIRTDRALGVEHIAALAYTCCVIAAVVTARNIRRPSTVTAAYLLSVLFVAPVFLFTDAQGAIAGMVVAHGLQYLWIIRWRRRQGLLATGRAGWQIILPIVVVAVVGGSALEALSELQSTGDATVRVLYSLYAGVVMTHFATDGLLWRRPTPSSVASPRRPSLLPSLAHGRS